MQHIQEVHSSWQANQFWKKIQSHAKIAASFMVLFQNRINQSVPWTKKVNKKSVRQQAYLQNRATIHFCFHCGMQTHWRIAKHFWIDIQKTYTHYNCIKPFHTKYPANGFRHTNNQKHTRNVMLLWNKSQII